MDFNLIYKVMVFIILISLQYTLNLILKEVKNIRNELKTSRKIKIVDEEGSKVTNGK